MKFAQRLSCAMLLLLAGVFSLGGFVLVYVNSADMLRQAAAQAEQWHRMQYYTLETEVLGLMARGEEVTDDALTERAMEIADLATTAAKAASGWEMRMVCCCFPRLARRPPRPARAYRPSAGRNITSAARRAAPIFF